MFTFCLDFAVNNIVTDSDVATSNTTFYGMDFVPVELQRQSHLQYSIAKKFQLCRAMSLVSQSTYFSCGAAELSILSAKQTRACLKVMNAVGKGLGDKQCVLYSFLLSGK